MDLLTILVFIVSKYICINAIRLFNVNGKDITYAVKNESMELECETRRSIAYCGFTDPSGKRYSFAEQHMSHCKVAFRATKEHEGVWQCHIGSKQVGVEEVNNILVKVVDKFAAIKNNISALHGLSETLECTNIEGRKPIKYCRFEPPNNMPFSINSKVDRTNRLINRYYYPSDKSLDRGDCAVTIEEVSYADQGLWTCGAGLEDGKEYIDYIQLDVTGLNRMTTAYVTGIALMTVAIVLILGGFGVLAWRYRINLLNAPQVPEEHELQQMRRVLETPPPSQQGPIPIVNVEPPSL